MRRMITAVLKIVIAMLACVVIVLVPLGLYLSQATYSDFVSAISIFVIALLTLAYVVTTSRQLSTMQKQLHEMKRSRELMSQPLPFVTPSRVFLEKPRAFYSPPEKSYTGGSRYHVECNVHNHGSSPGVSIHVCTCLVIPHKEKPKVFRCAAEYIDVLAEKSSLKPFDTFAPSFMFPGDDTGLVIDAIRSRHPKNIPVLKLCTVYKNLLGAAFGCRQSFQIFPKLSDQDTILKNWHSQVSTFASAFKHEIEQMKRIVDKNEDEWARIFEKIKADYSSKVEGEDLDLMCRQIPGAFKIEAISEEQYQAVVSGGNYGHFMPEPDHCLIEDQT